MLSALSNTRSPLYVTSLVAGAFFMETLDGTVIATALPQMGHSFHVHALDLNIGITAYLLALAVFIPVSGWVADRFGSCMVFAGAVCTFTFASMLCGLSHTLTEFTAMRVLQGLGGAMMVPVGRLIVLRATPKANLTKAMAYITWPGLAGLVVGPALGGFMTTYASWRWVFFLNLPLGVVGVVLAILWIKNEQADERYPFDFPTFSLGGIASVGAVYGIEKLGSGASGSKVASSLLCVSLVCGVLTIVLARRRPETSLIDFEALRRKSYSLSVFGASLFRISVSVLPFLLPLMFQTVFGLSAFQSGLYLLVLFGGDLTFKLVVVQVLRRYGFRRIILVNGVLTALTVAACALLTQATPRGLLLTLLFVHGACRSMEFTCLTTLAFTEIPTERMSRANGFLSAVMQLSLGVGVALGAITLRMVAQLHGHAGSAPQLADFHGAILLMALLCLGPVIDGWSLAPDAGAGTSGHL